MRDCFVPTGRSVGMIGGSNIRIRFPVNPIRRNRTQQQRAFRFVQALQCSARKAEKNAGKQIESKCFHISCDLRENRPDWAAGGS